MKILISGYYGHMGQVLKDMVLNDNELELVCGVDINAKNISDENNNKIKVFENFKDVDVDFDLVIDFSSHLATKDLINFVVEKNKKLVLATTGQTKEELDIINEASNNSNDSGSRIPSAFPGKIRDNNMLNNNINMFSNGNSNMRPNIKKEFKVLSLK